MSFQVLAFVKKYHMLTYISCRNLLDLRRETARASISFSREMPPRRTSWNKLWRMFPYSIATLPLSTPFTERKKERKMVKVFLCITQTQDCWPASFPRQAITFQSKLSSYFRASQYCSLLSIDY